MEKIGIATAQLSATASFPMSFEQNAAHPWRARVGVALVILVLAFIGLATTNIKSQGGWIYWRIMAAVCGFLALWLSFYLRRKKLQLSTVKLWHECLHWLGLILAVMLISLFVQIGIMSRFLASLNVLTVLSLSLYLAGVYIEFSFIPIGIFLGLFTAIAAFIEQYLYLFMIPVALIAIGTIFWVSKKSHQKT